MLRKAAAITPPPDPTKPWEAIEEASTHYSENCLRFCDRAPVCRAQALALGDPAVLGDEMGRFLGEIGLHRSLELLAGARAKTPAEEDLVRRLDEAELKT